MKSKYITPEITVVEFKVEAGFATSAAQAAGEFRLNGGNFVGAGDGGSGSGDWLATGMGEDDQHQYQGIFQ